MVKDYRSTLDHIPTAVKQFVAGGLAGAASKTAVAPLERTKVLTQIDSMKRGHGHGRSVLSVVADTLRTEGVLAFFKGNGANVVRIVPNKGILFLCNERIGDLMRAGGEPLSDTRRLVAGSISGLVQLTLTYPLDLTQTRLASGAKYRGIAHCLSETYAKGGLRGVYAGYLPSCAGVMPYTGVQFLAYHRVCSWLQDPAAGACTPVQKLFAGAAAGFMAQSVSYPLDTVRRRMQVQGTLQKPLYSGAFDCARQILASEGPRGLVRGMWLNALRAGPSQAIQFTVYSWARDRLGIGEEKSTRA